jgi:hypothetical protein
VNLPRASFAGIEFPPLIPQWCKVELDFSTTNQIRERYGLGPLLNPDGTLDPEGDLTPEDYITAHSRK